MKKFWIQFLFLTIIALAGLYFTINPNVLESLLPTAPSFTEKKIQIKDTIVTVAVADNSKERSAGLSGKESLAVDQGMLFIFSETKKYSFWMKGMKFPLDMIFIREGKIVDLLKNIPLPIPNQPDSQLPIYQPVVPIDMLLEVNSGFIDQHNIMIGDAVYQLN